MPDSKSCEYVGKYLFCPLGEASKRGVVRVTRNEMVARRIDGKYDFREIRKTRMENVTSYECGLGDIGKECIIPILYERYSAGIQAHNNLVSRDTPVA